MPSLITGDDKATMTTSFSQGQVDTDVTADNIWIKRSDDKLTTKTLKIDGAMIFNDRFQAGASIPFQMRSQSHVSDENQSSGLGDISGLVGYEYLPDWDYNPWRPKGVGFLTLTLPTGKSIQESETISGIDSRGRGLWAIGVGTTLTKSWTHIDANSTFEVHRAFNKDVHNSQMDGTLKPGYGSSFGVGAGYNVKDFRVGTSLTWTYEDAINVDGANSSTGSVERFATAALQTSYVFDQGWAGTVSYADQTLMGSPIRTTLSKVWSLSIQKRWAR